MPPISKSKRTVHCSSKHPDSWVGYVRYAVSPGLRHLECVAGDRVRRA